MSNAFELVQGGAHVNSTWGMSHSLTRGDDGSTTIEAMEVGGSATKEGSESFTYVVTSVGTCVSGTDSTVVFFFTTIATNTSVTIVPVIIVEPIYRNRETLNKMKKKKNMPFTHIHI